MSPQRDGLRPARGPLVVLPVLAVVLVGLGHAGPAVVAVVAAPLMAQANTLSPAFVRFVEQSFAPAVGRVVTFVLLVPIQLFVFLPVSVLGRLVGSDPVRRAGGRGRWQGRGPDHDGRSTRTFADERGLGGGVGWSARAAIATLAVGIAIGLVAPSVIDRTGSDAPSELSVGRGFNAMDSPAIADAPWADQAEQELNEVVTTGQTYTPYVGYSLRDYESRYVNVTDRQRLTYSPEGLDQAEDVVEVWFFGGSTMFGASAQRDLHTIPSEVVRIAERDGVMIRARNFGVFGYVNFQETVLLTQLLLAGGRPDVVVFYDGINDLALQLHRSMAFGEVGELGDLSAQAIRRFVGGELMGSAGAAAPLNPQLQVGDTEALVEGLVRTLGQGIELAETLADRYGFVLVHSWQPDLFSRAVLAEGERSLLPRLGYDEARFAALDTLSDNARAALPPDVVDLGAAFDDLDGPVLNDQVHTNEAGARAVAEALYPSIRSLLGAEDG